MVITLHISQQARHPTGRPLPGLARNVGRSLDHDGREQRLNPQLHPDQTARRPSPIRLLVGFEDR